MTRAPTEPRVLYAPMCLPQRRSRSVLILDCRTHGCPLDRGESGSKCLLVCADVPCPEGKLPGWVETPEVPAPEVRA
jgi:hypothetical protein